MGEGKDTEMWIQRGRMDERMQEWKWEHWGDGKDTEMWIQRGRMDERMQEWQCGHWGEGKDTEIWIQRGRMDGRMQEWKWEHWGEGRDTEIWIQRGRGEDVEMMRAQKSHKRTTIPALWTLEIESRAMREDGAVAGGGNKADMVEVPSLPFPLPPNMAAPRVSITPPAPPRRHGNGKLSQ